MTGIFLPCTPPSPEQETEGKEGDDHTDGQYKDQEDVLEDLLSVVDAAHFRHTVAVTERGQVEPWWRRRRRRNVQWRETELMLTVHDVPGPCDRLTRCRVSASRPRPHRLS